MTALREAACCSNKFWECHLLVCTHRWAPSPWPPRRWASAPGPAPAAHRAPALDLQVLIQELLGLLQGKTLPTNMPLNCSSYSSVFILRG